MIQRRKVSREDRYYVMDCFFEWLGIRGDPGSLGSLRVDLSHSALFARLCDGKDPLPNPPPRAFAYPWYRLIENGYDTACEANQHGDQLIINQSAWEIVEKTADGWLVTHERTPGETWRVFPDPEARSDIFAWRIERAAELERRTK